LNLWLKQASLVGGFGLANGIPCADTFRRVFERMTRKLLSSASTLGRDVGRAFRGASDPIDGKTLKGSYNRERQKKSALHVVGVHGQVSIASVLGQKVVRNQ